MTVVQRFVRPLAAVSLEAVLRGEERPTERLPGGVALEPLEEAIEHLSPTLSGSDIDATLVEPVHMALAAMSRSDAADMRVWHWLNSVAFPGLVWRRWRPRGEPDPSELSDALTSAMVRRFAGSSSLFGVSRNTLARLWWTAEHLAGDYELARFALSRQDMHQAIFDRLFGVYEPAARAALARFRGHSEDEIRAAARWLTFAASTTALEFLSEDEVGAILDEALGPQPEPAVE